MDFSKNEKKKKLQFINDVIVIHVSKNDKAFNWLAFQNEWAWIILFVPQLS